MWTWIWVYHLEHRKAARSLVKTHLQTASNCHFILLGGEAWRTHPIKYLQVDGLSKDWCTLQKRHFVIRFLTFFVYINIEGMLHNLHEQNYSGLFPITYHHHIHANLTTISGSYIKIPHVNQVSNPLEECMFTS